MRCPRRRRRHEVHVYREVDSDRWIVAIGTRAVSRHRWQRTAVVTAIRLAHHRHADVVTHARNGQFRSKDSYGNETAVEDREH